MKSVRVIFKDDRHNYTTSVGNVSIETIAEYFVGTVFDIGLFPEEKALECVAVEITHNGVKYKIFKPE